MEQEKNSDVRLLPCPLCGETQINYETTITERAIRCSRCSLSLVRDISTVLPEHVWNTRAATAALGELVESAHGLPNLLSLIENLPEDVFGYDAQDNGADAYQWAIRDEAVAGLKRIQVALAKSKSFIGGKDGDK